MVLIFVTFVIIFLISIYFIILVISSFVLFIVRIVYGYLTSLFSSMLRSSLSPSSFDHDTSSLISHVILVNISTFIYVFSIHFISTIMTFFSISSFSQFLFIHHIFISFCFISFYIRFIILISFYCIFIMFVSFCLSIIYVFVMLAFSSFFIVIALPVGLCPFSPILMSRGLFFGVPGKDYLFHFLHLLLFSFSILSLIDDNAHRKDARQEPGLFYCLHSIHFHLLSLVLPSQVAYQPSSLLWQYTVDLLLQVA